MPAMGRCETLECVGAKGRFYDGTQSAVGLSSVAWHNDEKMDLGLRVNRAAQRLYVVVPFPSLVVNESRFSATVPEKEPDPRRTPLAVRVTSYVMAGWL